MDDVFDVALLEEVCAFLHSSDPLAPSLSLASLDTKCDLGVTSDTNRDDEAALKRRHQREKKMIRKQRYERRRKQERETLRRMEKLLTAQLLSAKQARENEEGSAVARMGQINSAVRDLAQWERSERRRAEEEQKRLVEALTVQAAYLSKLQEMLPEHMKVFAMNTICTDTFTCETEQQIDSNLCGF